MFICVTEVDAVTKVPCTLSPMRTGPSMPVLKGLNLDWADKSTWPITTNAEGVYDRAPKYYGTCDDDADISVPGVLEILDEAEWMLRKNDEFYARKPFPSWVWDATTLTWNCPVSYPEGADVNAYSWDEETLSWKEVIYG